MSTGLGVDYAWAHPDPAAIRRAGYTFVVRYLSTDPSKNLSPAERDALWANGLSILLVWETTAGRALKGTNAGLADATHAIAEASKLGHPIDAPIFFACDTDTTVDKVRPYFKGVAAVRSCCGAYGGIDVVDPLLADHTVRFGWQACAWSDGKVSDTAHLYQRLHPTTHLTGSFDEDVLLRPLPMWNPPGLLPPTQPTAPSLEDDMAERFIYLVPKGEPGQGDQFYELVSGKLTHIDGETSKGLTDKGVRIVTVSAANLRDAGAQL